MIMDVTLEQDKSLDVQFNETLAAIAGKDGLSAYEIAVKNGFVGTEQEWLNSLEASKTEVIDNLTSIDTDKALSANQGKVLNDKVKDLGISPEQHAAVFRGKNLGSAITDAQKAAIADGSFKDLFIGDYWVINNITWRIADMDYWYNTSKNSLTRHHLVMIPDTCLFKHIMKNDVYSDTPSTTVGGYHLTDMHRKGLDEARSMVIKAFGADMCVSHKEAFINAVTDGKPSGFLFEDSWLDLPTEIMMYGTNIFSVASDGGTPPPAVITYCRTQLALFDIAPKFIVSPRQTYWLRDIVSDGQYAAVNAGGYATHSGSEFSLGVRPVFCIG